MSKVSKRAADGAFMTPMELAEHFAKRALDRWDQAVEIPVVLDPACGTGNLLIAFARELAARASEAARKQGHSLDRSGVLATLGQRQCLQGLELDAERAEEARRRLVELTGQEEAAKGVRTCDALFTDWPLAAVVIGNPPFLGGGRVSSLLGKDYQKRLQTAFPTWRGHADLSVCWLLKAHEQKARLMSWIATNTISQGDSREAGLAHLLRAGWLIKEAETEVQWPGDAAVSCVIVHMVREGPTCECGVKMQMELTDARRELEKYRRMSHDAIWDGWHEKRCSLELWARRVRHVQQRLPQRHRLAIELGALCGDMDAAAAAVPQRPVSASSGLG